MNTDTITAEMIAAAEEATSYFQTLTRDSGEKFVTLKEDRPEWVQAAIRTAHGMDADGAPTLLPDDYIYRFAEEAFWAISEASEGEHTEEVADGMSEADVHDLLKWLSSNLNRPAICDEAAEEFGAIELDLLARISIGQSYEKRNVFTTILSAVAERAESLSEA